MPDQQTQCRRRYGTIGKETLHEAAFMGVDYRLTTVSSLGTRGGDVGHIDRGAHGAARLRCRDAAMLRKEAQAS